MSEKFWTPCAGCAAPLTVDDHDHAVEFMVRYGFSLYDSVVAASALHADCDVLFTEDLHHGQLIEQQLSIINPFQ